MEEQPERSAPTSQARALSVEDPAGLRVWAEGRLQELGSEGEGSSAALEPYAILGLCAFWTGDFAAVDELLERSSALVGDAPWSDDVAASVVLQRSLAGSVAALRGEFDRSEQEFSAALSPMGGAAVERARVIAYSTRAALASDGNPDRALEDVRQARELAASLGNAKLAALAAVGEGWALSELGQLVESAQILTDAASQLPGALERSVASLRLAEVEMRCGRRDRAREIVDEARTTFVDHDARYWAARAALLTGSIDRDRGGRWLKMARELSLPDSAYERLFFPVGALRIEPGSMPAVFRDGEPVQFLTRHAEAAVRLLATAGAAGSSSEELAEIFWPSVAPEKQRARLRTLLWQVRNSLGSDAWRIQRVGDTVRFDRTGVELVGRAKRSAIAAEFRPSSTP